MQEILDKIKIFNDPNFIFNENSHTYTYGNEKLTSVTTFIKNFSEPFDTEYWSKRKAKDRLAEKRKISREHISDNDPELETTIKEILSEWDYKRDIACDMGTDVHKYIEEKFTIGSTITRDNFTDLETLRRIDKFESLYESKLHNLIPVAQELRIFSRKLKLAGTIDALFIRNGKLMILDWKTNKKMSTDSDKCWNKLRPPFQDEWENELNKYSIQLNLYKLILSEYDIHVDSCALVYIPPSVNDPKIFKIKDYEKQLRVYFGLGI
jgi:ATP-dependent exoDNAse (exonuclease V) beta subunit